MTTEIRINGDTTVQFHKDGATFPDFFIIGAPKCGTTTLYDWLNAHEDVFMPGKELCFFSQDIFPTQDLIGHIPDLSAYRALFADPSASLKVKGDATPKYLHSDRALHEIQRLNSKPRLIVCVRDPVDLAVSLHSQKVREGWEREPDFAKAWARELGVDTPESARYRPGETNYVFWAHLGARLEQLFALFPSQDVLILHLREFRTAPYDVYVNVLRFLDLNNDGRELSPALNRRTGLRSPRLNRWLLQAKRMADPALRPLSQLRGGRGLGILKMVNRYNSINNAYVSCISEQLRDQMYDFLAADVVMAERYLKGPLKEQAAER